MPRFHIYEPVDSQNSSYRLIYVAVYRSVQDILPKQSSYEGIERLFHLDFTQHAVLLFQGQLFDLVAGTAADVVPPRPSKILELRNIPAITLLALWIVNMS